MPDHQSAQKPAPQPFTRKPHNAEKEVANSSSIFTSGHSSILRLQRTIGNRSTARLLASQPAIQREGEEEPPTETGTTESVTPPGTTTGSGETPPEGGDAGGTETDGETSGSTPVERWTTADQEMLDLAVADIGIIESYQAGLVPRAINALTRPAYDFFRSLLDNAAVDMERAFICKALAAGRTISEITTFATRINGRSERWLRRNLTLVNTAGGSGGMTQQYSDSCAPTVQQALRGQFDPVYALELRSSGNIAVQTPNAQSDPDSVTNRREAREQRRMLTSAGGALADRATGGGAGVSDTSYRQLVNRLANSTGVSYRLKYIPGDLSWDQAFRRMNTALDQGISMPAGVTSPPPSTGGHAVLLTHREGIRYQIHDPWTGETVWKRRSDFRSNTLNLPSGWNQMDMIMVPVELDLDRLRPDESATETSGD